MRKLKTILLFVLMVSCFALFSACSMKPADWNDSTMYPSTNLSDDTSFTALTIGGLDVTDGNVTMTTDQWNGFAESADQLAECTYTLAENATVAIAVDQEATMVTFTVTAQNGINTQEYQVDVTVLSNKATFTVLAINQNEVKNKKVYLTEEQYQQVLQADDLSSLYTAEVPEGATLTATLDTLYMAIEFKCVSQDQTKESTQRISVLHKNMFGPHSVTGAGSSTNGEWNDEYQGYLINGMVAAKDNNDNNLVNYYAYNFKLRLTDLSVGSEVVISSFQSDSMQIRYVLRGVDDNHFLLFTDYRENSGFLNYYELLTNLEYTEGQVLELGVINVGNSMIFLYNGETLYRRTLHSLTRSELVFNRVDYPFVINDIQITTGKSAVTQAYEQALVGYEDPFFGDNSIGYGFELDVPVKNDDGSIYIPGATSNTRVMGGYYYEGVPVGGHEFAISSTVRMQNTKESGGAASKAEFQLYKDANDSVKVHMFRFPTNNTLMVYEQINGVQTDITINKNGFPKGTDYTFNFIFLFKTGRVELWIKDNYETNTSVLLEDYTLMFAEDYDWNHCGFAFAMRQYADITWSDWNVYYNDNFDQLFSQLHPEEESLISFSQANDEFVKSNVITEGQYEDFYKESFEYGKAFVVNNGTIINGNKWLINATVNFTDYTTWGQGEFQFYQDEAHAVRYVFEYTGANFQVFTEIKDGNNWANWKLVRRPSTSTPAYLNMTAVNDNGHVYLLINDEIWHEYKDTGYTSLYATFGGQKASVKLTELSAETDAAKVDEFVESMEYYVYQSSYESRIKSLEAEYATAQKGGIVLAGSSTVDFWNTWQEDLGSKVLAYNVGIGGTTTYDWQVAYPRLIKPLQPSQILLFLGGNDVNGLNETGKDTAERLYAMLELMHADFPQANIVYVLSMPVPNNYKDGKYTTEYGNLVNAMRAYGEQNTSWLKTVDLESLLVSNNTPIAEYFKADNIHLTEAGYAVWTSVVKPLLVHENTVMKEGGFQVNGGSWDITTNEQGNKVYTSTSDGAWLTFEEIRLKNDSVIEFDMIPLTKGSSIVGVLFGMSSLEDKNGFCVGRASTGNPGDTWMKNGAPNGYAQGDTVQIKMTNLNVTYKIKIVCNIAEGKYTMYIDGEYARLLYFETNASNADKDTLYTGPFFGLYGGKSGGRTTFANIVVDGVKV